MIFTIAISIPVSFFSKFRWQFRMNASVQEENVVGYQSVVGRNLDQGTSVVMTFVGRELVVLAFAQVYEKKNVVGYQSLCPLTSLVSLLGHKIGVFAVVCGACVQQDCYRPLDVPLVMDTHVDITAKDVEPQFLKVYQWAMMTPPNIDVRPNRPVRRRRQVALWQELRSRVVKEDGVSSLLVTNGSGVPIADDNIDPRGGMPTSTVAAPVARESSTYNAVDQTVPPTNEIASSNGSNKKRVVQPVFELFGIQQ
ncbi:hypothetical protein Tco_0417876 [Tanacetum coccineum]